jgi:hypothetical protein
LIFERNYGLIAVRFKEAGVAKLADAPDLGSGGAILRGSSPLSGKSFIVRDLRYKLRWNLNVLSQQMQACVSVFEDVSFFQALGVFKSKLAQVC